MRCGRCGEDNREGRKFCAACGAALGWTCPGCGFANEPGEAFCGGCGSKRPAPAGTSPAAPLYGEAAGERRQVAILFADLCGFTALSTTLDAEDLRRLVEAFYGRADAIVARYGGAVDKHIGDAVMALFGAPIAHGDDGSRAVRAALEIAATAGEIADPAGRALAAHVGIAMGEVVAGGIGRGYTVLGDAVNLAARLVELAGPGEVVIADGLMRLLEGRIRATSLGPAALKGIAGPVTGWRVEGIEALGRPASPFIGRETDRRLLNSLLDACLSEGRGRVVVLRGEAGIGKSRLIDEVLVEASGRGFATHKALVLDFGAARGLDARGMLTRSLLGLPSQSSDEARRAAAAEAEARGLLRDGEHAFLGELLDLPPEAEDRALVQAMEEATRHARRRALLAGLLVRLAQQRPILAAVEDIHWADAVLLDDLAELGAATAQAPLLLLLSTRPEGDPLDRRWRAKLGPAAIGTIDLAPLSQAESSRLAEGLLGIRDERTAACVDRAGGNPFFLEQLLRHTGEVARASVPASVQTLIQGRADRLPPEEKRALQAASVLGQRLPPAALRHLLGKPDYAPDRLVDQQFMRRDGGELAFVHALVRDGIYGSLLKARRRELHRAAADWYAKRDLVLWARHLDLAEAPEAAAAYLAAGEAAAAAYRLGEALDLAGRGLALARDSGLRASLASLRGELLQGRGRTKEAVADFETAAREAAPGRQRLRAWLGLVHGLTVLDRLAEAAALLDQAEEEARAHDLPLELSRVHTLRGNVHFPRGEIAQCLAAHREALRLAELAGAAEDQARALGGLADANYMRGSYRSAGELFGRCVELSAARGFHRIEAANLPLLAMMTMYQTRFAEGMRHLERALVLAERIGHSRAAMLAQHGCFFMHMETGQYDRALEAANAAHDIATALGARRFIGEALTFRALVEHGRGEARAIETICAAKEIAREQPTYMLPWTLGVQALIARDAGERAAALAEGEAVLAAGAVSHNFVFFNRYAMEASLAAKDWPAVERYAGALERAMAPEPLPFTDFLVARGRALAAAGRGEANRAELERLLGEARRLGWQAVAPALEAALAGTTAAPPAGRSRDSR